MEAFKAYASPGDFKSHASPGDFKSHASPGNFKPHASPGDYKPQTVFSSNVRNMGHVPDHNRGQMTECSRYKEVFMTKYCKDKEFECPEKNNDTENNSDIFIVDEKQCEFYFCPIDFKVKEEMMSRFNFLPKNVIEKSCSKKKLLTHPLKVIAVPRNGSCYYHCISFCITDCIEYAEAIRSCIDKVIYTDKICQGLLQSTCSKEQLEQHKEMLSSKRRWATDLDILASSYLFNLPIYVFTDGKWLKHDLNKTNKDCGLYLMNKNNHYNVVVDVKLVPSIGKDIVSLEEIDKTRKIVCGSFSQNNAQFSDDSVNSQCMANCAVFLCTCPTSF